MEPMSWTAAVGVLVAIVAGIVVSSGGILLAWLNSGGRLVNRVDELTTQVFKAQNERLECERKHANSELKLADALHDISQYQRRVERLEAATGLTPPPASIPGLVVVSLDGRVIEFSPALTSMLGWTPAEMAGASIERLVPPELIDRHRAGFASALVPGAKIDPAKKIHTYALDRNGRRVPVSISVRKWAEGGFMTAMIQARPSAEMEQARKATDGDPMRKSVSVEDVIGGKGES